MLKTIAMATLIILTFLLLGHTIIFSVNRVEQLECQEWFIQSENLPNWYALDWQKSQCQKYNFDI
jgi:hypothetical protein